MASSSGWAINTGRRCLFTGGRCVPTGTVLTTDEHDDPKQEEEDDGDDPNYLHPARWAGDRSPIGPSHARLLLVRVITVIPATVYENTVSSSKSVCRHIAVTYTPAVPKLWTETIEAHRREVRDAILDTTAALVAEHGLLSVTMSQIAEETGIGRATLYKYFPDVEAILFAWHEGQIASHLEHLADVRDRAGDPRERLEAVLEAYALISHESREHHDSELATFLHRDEQVARAQHKLRGMIRDLLTEGAEAGYVRGDVAPDELASYCLHALAAAGTLRSKAAVRRLVAITLAGLHPPR
jgi:AcrR family transcriptional regulator